MVRISFLLLACLFFLDNTTSSTSRPDLGFLYPIKHTQLPQTSNLTTYSFQYIYEKTKFDLHNRSWNLLKTTLASSAFNISNYNSLPLPQLASSILALIQSNQDTYKDLEHMAQIEIEHGTKAAVNETVNITSEDWYSDITYGEITKFALLVQNDGDHSPGRFEEDGTYQNLFKNMVLLHSEVFSYHQQLQQLYKLLTGVQQKRLSETTYDTFTEHIGPVKPDSYINSIESTYYRSGQGIIDFEIKVIVNGELKTFLEYKAIPYLNFKINRTYYSEPINNRLFSIECINNVCSEVEDDICGEALYQKDLTDILITCPFEYESAKYEITDHGIFIYTTPSTDLQALLDKYHLKVDRYPTLVQFQGCYNLKQGNVAISGCLDLENTQYTSRYDTSSLQVYLNPSFYAMVWKFISNGPWILTVLLLPTTLILMMCGCTMICKKICSPKPKYRPIVDHEMAHVNRIHRNRRHKSGRSSRSNKSSQ